MRKAHFHFSLFVLALVLLHCRPAGKATGGKLKIVTTTGMLEDAVKNISGDSVEVEALMGPGVDPHLYKATQGDLQKLTDSDIIIYNGLFLEGKMEDIFKRLGKIKPVIPAAEEIDTALLLDFPLYEDTYDPHVWFDVQLWSEVVKYINRELQILNPKNAAYFQKNTESYLKKLDSLDHAVAEQIRSIPKKQRVLITAHDAFGYFGRAYDIEVKGLQGISTSSEFGLKDITDLVKFIVDRKIKAVFIESSVSPKAIEAVVEGARQRGFEVKIGGTLYSDAMGEKGTFEGTYIGMVHSNVKTIVEELK